VIVVHIVLKPLANRFSPLVNLFQKAFAMVGPAVW
jgi:hypothetical protein